MKLLICICPSASEPILDAGGEARRGVVGLAVKTAGDRLMMVMESANGKMLKGRGKTSYCAKQLAGFSGSLTQSVSCCPGVRDQKFISFIDKSYLNQIIVKFKYLSN